MELYNYKNCSYGLLWSWGLIEFSFPFMGKWKQVALRVSLSWSHPIGARKGNIITFGGDLLFLTFLFQLHIPSAPWVYSGKVIRPWLRWHRTLPTVEDED